MPRRLATAVAVLISCTAAVAGARRQRIQRFHPLTERFMAHLGPAARDNVHAVVRYGQGLASGVLVSGRPGQTRTGLVLTSEHVFRAHLAPFVEFADGKQGVIRRVIAAEKKLDYVLLEVDLPGDTGAAPAHLRGTAVRAGEAIYSVSATTNPKAVGSPVRVTTARWRLLVELLDRGFLHTLQKGIEIGGGTIHRVASDSERYKVDSYLFKMPNAPGMSGSPVFSADTHEMVALHWGGNHRPRFWGAGGVPTRRILHDLTLKLQKGQIASDMAPPVKSLLDEAMRR